MRTLAQALLYKQATPGQTGESKQVAPELDQWLSKPDTSQIDVIRSMLELKCEEGEKKYGARLHTFNGRDPLADLAQELVDGLQYAWQAKQEADERGLVGVGQSLVAWQIAIRLRNSLQDIIALKQSGAGHPTVKEMEPTNE